MASAETIRQRGAIRRRSRPRSARSPRGSATGSSTSQAVREQHGNTPTWIAEPAAGRGGVSAVDRGRAGRSCASARAHACRSSRSAPAPRSRATSTRRYGGVSHRLPRHEPRARRARRGSRLRGRAGRHPQAAQRASARPGPVLPDRSRRRRLARRHGGDARLRHQRGALRHDEGQRAGAQGGAGERRGDHDGAPRQEVLGRLRPDAAVRRLGGHARRHHRDDAASCTASRRRSPAASARSRRSRPPATPTIATIQSGIPVARIELLDALQVKAVQRLFEAHACRRRRCCSSSSTAPRPASPSSPSASARSPREHGGGPFDWATKAEDRTRLWQARHDAYWAARRRCGPARRRSRPTSACRSRGSPNASTETQARHRGEPADRADRRPCRRRQFPPHAAGRPGRSRRGRRAPRACCERLVERALAMDGTCTGEHGVGQGKMKYLAAEHGEPALDVDARDQAGARPAEHHEPRQDRRAL